MSNKTTDTQSTTTAIAPTGLLPTFVTLGTNLAERSVAISFDLAQDIRAELKSAADLTIGYADSMARAALGLTRTIVTRVDQLASTSLEQGRTTALALVHNAQRTGAQASTLAGDAWSNASGGVFGQRETPSA